MADPRILPTTTGELDFVGVEKFWSSGSQGVPSGDKTFALTGLPVGAGMVAQVFLAYTVSSRILAVSLSVDGAANFVTPSLPANPTNGNDHWLFAAWPNITEANQTLTVTTADNYTEGEVHLWKVTGHDVTRMLGARAENATASQTLPMHRPGSAIMSTAEGLTENTFKGGGTWYDAIPTYGWNTAATAVSNSNTGIDIGPTASLSHIVHQEIRRGEKVRRKRFVTVREPWTAQPQGPVEVDWSNPITRGLLIAATPFSPFSTQPIRRAYKDGIYCRQGVLQGAPITHGVPNSTVVVVSAWIDPDTEGGFWNSNDLVYRDSTSAYPNDQGLNVYGTRSYGNIGFRLRATNGDGVEATVDVAADYGYKSLLVHGATIDSNLLISGWGNGIYGGTSTQLQGWTFNPPAATNLPPAFGNTFTTDLCTAQSLVLRWGRVLSAAEMQSITSNPWQVFRRTRRIFTGSPVLTHKRRRML